MLDPTNDRFDKRLVGMVLEMPFEDVSLDRSDNLEEMRILGNCSTSNFILTLILGR